MSHVWCNKDIVIYIKVRLNAQRGVHYLDLKDNRKAKTVLCCMLDGSCLCYSLWKPCRITCQRIKTGWLTYVLQSKSSTLTTPFSWHHLRVWLMLGTKSSRKHWSLLLSCIASSSPNQYQAGYDRPCALSATAWRNVLNSEWDVGSSIIW